MRLPPQGGSHGPTTALEMAIGCNWAVKSVPKKIGYLNMHKTQWSCLICLVLTYDTQSTKHNHGYPGYVPRLFHSNFPWEFVHATVMEAHPNKSGCAGKFSTHG